MTEPVVPCDPHDVGGLGGWAWALVALAGVGHVAFAHARARRSEGRPLAAVALWGGVWALIWMLLFVVVPEAAYRGWIPGSQQLSLCEESPGSGCGGCVASAESEGLSTERCYEPRYARWALELAALGPGRRAAALARLED